MSLPFPPHPISIQGHPNGFTDGKGDHVQPGDMIQHCDGREGRLDEALHDGIALVTWDDGTYGDPNWKHLAKWPDWYQGKAPQ